MKIASKAYLIGLFCASIFPASAATQAVWAAWSTVTAGSPGTAVGTIGSSTVTYAGDNAGPYTDAGQWLPATTYAGGPITNAPPTATTAIKLQGGTAHVNTITFSSPVTNPVLAITSLGGNNPANFTFNMAEPFSIIACGASQTYGGGCITQAANVVNGLEGSGTVQFTGTYTSLSWTNPTFENFYIFTVGVPIQAPTVSKTFSPGAVVAGGPTTSLVFTITNPNPIPLTNLVATDNLPTGITKTGVITASAGCGAGSDTSTATVISATGYSVPANGICTLTVSGITYPATPGVYVNTAQPFTTTEAPASNAASAALVVVVAPTATKTFAPTKIGPGGTSTVTIAITNPNTGTLVNLNFTDTLPSGVTTTTPVNLTNTCGGTAVANPGSVSLAAGVLLPAATCAVSFNVTANEGQFSNSVTVAGTIVDLTLTATATATLSVATPPRLSKTFGAVSIGVNNTTTLSFTLMNPNQTTTLTGLAFTDTLPVGLVVATPSVVTGTCGAGVITAAAGGNSIALSGGSLAAQASCTFTVGVTANGAAIGLLTNTTSTVSSVQATNGAAAVANVFVGDPFQITYAANLAVGDSVVNITNVGTLGAALQSGTTASITGSICANVYAFTPDEQLVSCCSCPVTPGGLVSLSAQNDLASNTLTPAVPTALVVKVVGTAPVAGSCNNSAAAVGANALANGLKGFGTTIHATPQAGSYGVTETALRSGTLSAGELSRIGNLCNFILANGSGFGVCRTCRLGGLGGARE